MKLQIKESEIMSNGFLFVYDDKYLKSQEIKYIKPRYNVHGDDDLTYKDWKDVERVNRKHDIYFPNPNNDTTMYDSYFYKYWARYLGTVSVSIYKLLCTLVDEKMVAKVAITGIAKYLNVTDKTVRKNLQLLEQCCFIKTYEVKTMDGVSHTEVDVSPTPPFIKFQQNKINLTPMELYEHNEYLKSIYNKNKDSENVE
jgi:hypothetical protein